MESRSKKRWAMGGLLIILAVSGILIRWLGGGRGALHEPDSTSRLTAPVAKVSLGPPAVPPKPIAQVKSIEQMKEYYQGENWIIRREKDGRVKRILGARIPLGERSLSKILEFSRDVSPIFGLKPQDLMASVEPLQDAPLQSPNEGVIGFRVRQQLAGHPVIDGSMKVFVDMGDATVTMVEGADIQEIRDHLEQSKVLTRDSALNRAGRSTHGKLIPMSTYDGPEVAVSSEGKPALVYRFIQNSGSTQKEIWVDAGTGRKMNERPMSIAN